VKTKPPTLASHVINAVLKHVRTNKDSLIATPGPAPENPFAELSDLESKGDSETSFASRAGAKIDTSILLAGIDWGATKTTIKAAYAGADELLIDETIPTVLGYPKDGLVATSLPENATTLCGREALTHRRHLQLTHPTLNSTGAVDFAGHLRGRLQGQSDVQIRAVIAVPPNFDGVLRENLRQTLSERFDSVILLPSPYLGALGFNLPNARTILIDIGATAITACVLQGCYPAPDEQITIDFGGNDIDGLLRAAILEKNPDAELSPITIRLLKEKHSCVGYPEKPIHVDIILSGQPKTVDLTDEITTACNELLYRTAESIKTLLLDNAVESEPILPIILTGGASRIKNFARELKTILLAEGCKGLRVSIASVGGQSLVAAGALRAARAARQCHWQQVAR
jgi:rod shape-determining protein MreB